MLLHVVTPVESGAPKRESFRFAWDGQSVRRLAKPWADGPDGWYAIIDGKVIEDDDWNRPLNRGADVSIVPKLGDPATIGTTIVSVVVQVGISLAINALLPPPKIPESGDDRSSPTFGFELRTSTLPGGSIPILIGEHDAPGQLIHTELAPHIDSFRTTATFNGNSGNEVLSLILALSSGPIHRIGGENRSDPLGSLVLNGAPQLPASIRVNSVLLDRGIDVFSTPAPGAIAELRMGTIDQEPMTIVGDTKTVVTVGIPLEEAGDSGTVVISSTILSGVWVNIRFPTGLFVLSLSTGVPGTDSMDSIHSNGGFGFRIETRDVTDPLNPTPWAFDSILRVRTDPIQAGIDGTTVDHDPTDPRAAFTVQAQVSVMPGVVSMEVRVERITPRLGNDSFATIVSAAVFTAATFTTAQGLAYPDVALLGLRLLATDKLKGGDINIRARVKGALVRVWDPVHGFSEPTWGIPFDPNFQWMNFPPANNCAWALGFFLTTNQGLGEFTLNGKPITDANIDWQAFRNWSDRCDIDFYSGTDIFLACDLIMDTPRSAMDWIRAILTVGQASLVLVGNRISVTYQYRDAHGSVPARATFAGGVWTNHHVQLFSAANVADFQITYSNTSFRPTVIEARILNKDLDYERDLISVQDPNATGFDSPPGSVLNSLGVNKQAVDYIGVTRVKQARYLALFTHNVNRLSRKRYSFRAGVESIISQPGDLIGVQSTALRIGANASFGANVSPGHTGSQTFIQISEAITIPATEDWSVFVSDGDDGVTEGLIPQDASERTFAAGASINVFTPGSPATPLAINYEQHRPVAIGPLDSTVDTAQVISVTLNEDMTATIEAAEWHPEFFDITPDQVLPPPSATLNGPEFNADLVEEAAISTVTAPTPTPTPVPGLTVVATGSGSHRITWDFPPDATSQTARVYTRPGGGGRWNLLGEVTGTSIETSGLTAGSSVQVSVSTQDAQGNFAAAGDGLVATITVDEFPATWTIPQVQGFTGTVTGEGILFTWEPFNADWVDCYEIRRGTIWNHAYVVGKTKGDRMFHVAGAGSYDYMIRAKSKTGLYSATISTTGAIAFDDVVGTTPLATYPLDDLVTAAAGTLSAEVQYDATNDWVEFQTGQLRGTYTTTAIDGTTVADRWWSVNWDQHVERITPIEDLTFTVDGGDAMWWTLEGREATTAHQGVDFTLPDVDSTTVMVEDSGPLLRHDGSVGRHADVTVEARFHNGTSWGVYEPFHAGLRNAQQAQFRFTMNRDSTEDDLRISKITLFGATV